MRLGGEAGNTSSFCSEFDYGLTVTGDEHWYLPDAAIEPGLHGASEIRCVWWDAVAAGLPSSHCEQAQAINPEMLPDTPPARTPQSEELPDWRVRGRGP